MEELILFIKNHYEAILSVLTFIISMINLIYLIFTNKKKIAFKIENYTSADVDSKNFYMFNMEFMNKSRLSISINDLIFVDRTDTYSIIKFPKLLAEKSTTRNKEVIRHQRHQEVHSTKFPINITGLTSEQRFIVMYGPEKFENEKIKIILLTNRGKINIRDYATINELICLANLNSVFINDGLEQPERLKRLNQIAISQMQILNNTDIKYLNGGM